MAIPWLCLVILPVAGQVVHQWTSQRGGERSDGARALQVDKKGNAWVAGYTTSSQLDGRTNPGNAGDCGIFLMKFDARGVHQWTRLHGGRGRDEAHALQVDAVGNAWVAGYTDSSLDGNSNRGGNDVFLMKFDSQGVHLWTRQRGGENSNDFAYALQVDGNGNAWVAGCTYGSLDGHTRAGTNGWRDMFLMKFDAQGIHQWTRQRGDRYDDCATSLQVDAEGDAWVAGYTNSFHLDGQHRQRGTKFDVFLMRFDAKGVHQWTRVRGGEDNDRPSALQVDAEGNAWVAGWTQSSRLDGHSNAGEDDMFLMRFTAQGVHQWTRVHGIRVWDKARALQVDENSHAWMAGHTCGYSATASCDAFLIKFDAQGAHQWTRMHGGEDSDYAMALQVDPTGHDAWVAGYTGSSLDGHSNAGAFDIFLMKFQAECSQVTCPAGYVRSPSQKSGGNNTCCVLSSTSTSSWTSSTTASTSSITTASSTKTSTSITITKSSTTASTRTTSRTVSSTSSTTKASTRTTSSTVPASTTTRSTTNSLTRTTSRTVSASTTTRSTTNSLTRTTSRTVSASTSTRSTTNSLTRTASRRVSTSTSTILATKASATTTSTTPPASSIRTTSSTTAPTSTTSRKRSASRASTTSSTSVEQVQPAFQLSHLEVEQQSLTTTAAVGLDILKTPWTSNVQSIEPFLNPASTPSEEDSTGLPSEDDSTGLLVAAVVLPVLTACLCAALGICCYRAKLRQLRGAEAEPPQVPNPLAMLPPFARSVKPLIFAWESRMTAEWPRGKVQKLSVRETAFELRGHQFQFRPGQLRHFAWDDGTVQTLQSIHKNVVWWRTEHPHPAWQRFRWVCTPKCQVENHHDMEITSEGGYRCASCSRFRAAGKHWYCPQHQVHVCPACAELPPEMPTLGLAATYLVDVFPPVARRVTNNENPDFYEICPNLAHGSAGMGYNRTCPRDGRLHCSMVDALEDAYSGKVTHFVSWCWAYSLNNVVSAIERWLQKSNEDPQSVFLWMCFFCNNQYRIKEEATQTGSDELKEIFESHLVEAGRMLVLLDTIVQPTYVTRAWCIFESYVCIAQEIPMNIILPNTAETFFREAMEAGRIKVLTGAVDELNVRHARAGSEKDEDMIKQIILNTTGFDAVNRAVRSRLIDQLTILFRELFTPQPS